MNSDFLVIGIDPGKTGELWVLNSKTRKTVAYHDIDKLGNDIDVYGIVRFLKQFDINNSLVICEDPHPHGNTGVKTVYAGFEYGKGVGTIIGVVAALGFKMIRVSPPVWKGHFALTSSSSTYQQKKDLSVEKACYLSPEDAHLFCHKRIDKKVCRHDRAEAFLIATYGIDKHIVKQ